MSETFVISARLDNYLADKEHAPVLADACRRADRAVRHAWELVHLHLNDCLSSHPVRLPALDDGWFKSALQAVTTSSQTLSGAEYLRLCETRDRYMRGGDNQLTFDPPSRARLDQVLMGQAISMNTCFRVNVIRHFYKRVERYVWFTFRPRDRVHIGGLTDGPGRDRMAVRRQECDDVRSGGMTAEQAKSARKSNKLLFKRIASDLVAPPGTPSALLGEGEEESPYHAWVRFMRDMWRMNSESHRGVERIGDRYAKDPTPFLLAMRAMSRVFEGCDIEKAFSVCPQRRQQRTCFATFDSKSLRMVLGAEKTEHQEYLDGLAAAREEAHERSMQRRTLYPNMCKKNGEPKNVSEYRTLKARRAAQAKCRDILHARPLYAASRARCIQAWWRDVRVSRLLARYVQGLEQRRPRIDALLLRPSPLIAPRLVRLQRIIKRYLRRQKRARRDSLRRAKEVQCSALFNHNVLRMPRGAKPTGTIATDGVSVRVLMMTNPQQHRASRGRGKRPASDAQSARKKQKAAAGSRDSRKRKRAGEQSAAQKAPPRPLFSARDARRTLSGAEHGRIANGVWTMEEFRDSVSQYDGDERSRIIDSMQILGVDPGKAELAVT
ncbi:hypothetical protein AB1Y20_008595 [Prymnesium parvum]|uniref:Uncharacterized protein n=1 Tax=Prymnesium parvum TaxID=97485 RepID=A0AB34IRK7_PRYPA